MAKGRIRTSPDQEKFIKNIFAGWHFASKVHYHDIFFNYKDFVQDGPFDYPLFENQVLRHIADTNGDTMVLNKTTTYCQNMAAVDEIFDRTAVVHIIRDGRDVALSSIEAPGWGPSTIFGGARWWSGRVDSIQSYAAEHMAGRYLEVRYEDLIKNPVEVFAAITKLYGIYEASIQADLERTIVIKKGNSEKWRKRMSARQIERFGRVASSTLLRNNYALASDAEKKGPLPGWEYTFYRAIDAVYSRLNFDALWFRGIRVINSIIGIFPKLQEKFFRSKVFANHFNWRKKVVHRQSKNGK